MNRYSHSVISVILTLFCGLALLTLVTGCAEGGYPGIGTPYNSGYGGDPYYGRDYNRHDWEREHHEQRDFDREREHQHEDAVRHEAPPAQHRQELHCPSGTHPSSHRCTNEERKRGCKDYGAGNGQGCSNF